MSTLRRVVLVLGVLGLVALAGAAIAIRQAAAKRWAVALEREQATLDRLRSDDGAREPLGSPVRPGNAWDDYGPAFAGLAGLSDAEAAQPSGLMRAAVLRVRDGAGRARALYPSDPTSSAQPDYRGAIRAVTLLARGAREHREAGDAEATLDSLADALQVAADVGRVPRHVSLMAAVGPLADPGVDELRELVVASRTPSSSLARIRQIATGFDKQLPSSARAFAGEYASFVEGCRRFLADPAAERPSRWQLRRFGFSWRIHLAYLANNWGAIAENAGWRESADWASIAAAHAPADFDADSLSQSAVGMPVPSWLAAERRVRETRARLRLIQAVAIERLGRGPGGPEWPVDPFTLQAIHRREGEGSAVFWSAWTDGDQGGSGSWRPEAAKSPQDLVLELRP